MPHVIICARYHVSYERTATDQVRTMEGKTFKLDCQNGFKLQFRLGRSARAAHVAYTRTGLTTWNLPLPADLYPINRKHSMLSCHKDRFCQ